MKVIILTVFLLSLLCNCNFRTSDKPSIKILIDSLILVNNETCFKIVSSKSEDKILTAYVRCEKAQGHIIDLEKRILNDCDQQLEIEHDTVKIWVTYTSLGLKNFDNVTILLENIKTKKLSFIDTSFAFMVSYPR
ncbi:MAG: hypothetical protein IM600_16855 [Bacteroidetes bacterium]|nr:hypothetical protein [Bacteroidota bacterium]